MMLLLQRITAIIATIATSSRSSSSFSSAIDNPSTINQPLLFSLQPRNKLNFLMEGIKWVIGMNGDGEITFRCV